MAKLSREARMSIKVLTEKGVSNREVARLLGVSEGCVCYHRRRQTAGAMDGRSRQVRKAAAFQPAIERAQIKTLATCAWLRARESLLIQGQPGVGKTHLAIALGVKAVENGFSVLFQRLEELIAALKRDADLPPTKLRRRKYLNVGLLIIDEMGFEPMDRQAASLFFRLVSYRYGRGSILITTNKGIKDWPDLLAGDEVLATAILDRLLHHSHVINIKDRSYRLRDLEQAVSLRT